MTSAIELHNIHKTFKIRSWRSFLLRRPFKQIKVLRGASFTVKQGEIVSLLGLNGAGKSTLIKILASLVTPDKGTSKIQSFDTSLENHRTRSLIGLVNTNARSFYWRLTGKQNLTFFASLYNLSAGERSKRVDELLDWLGLANVANIALMKYSSGQQQRLAICRAMLSEPEIMLMDEPTNSLDPVAAAKLRKFVKDELAGHRNKAILWCTHLLNEAEEISNRIAILHNGKIITQDSLDTIKKRIEKENRYMLKIRCNEVSMPIFLKPIATKSTRTGDILNVEIKLEEPEIPLLLNKLVKADIEIFTVKPVEMPLEEVFEKLTLNTQH